jgi:hypothetical protein
MNMSSQLSIATLAIFVKWHISDTMFLFPIWHASTTVVHLFIQ